MGNVGDISKLCSGPAAPVMYIHGERADYRPYELEIARLKGDNQALEQSVAQLRAIAKQNKLRHSNARSIVKDLIEVGRISRDEANLLMNKHKRELPPEDRDLYDADLRFENFRK